MSSNSPNPYLIPLSILVAGGLIALAVFWSPNSAERQLAEVGGPASPTEIAFDLDGWPALGDPQAPITIVEYSDYACPFCAKFWEETLPLIKENYIDTGLVYFIYKDFAVVGGDRAAEAAHCADDQDAYWDYHDILFSQNSSDRARWSDSEIHRGYAETLGLNADQLVSCFTNRTYQDKVDTSTAEAINNGAQGTPHFFINDQVLVGAQPWPVFEGMIEDLL